MSNAPDTPVVIGMRGVTARLPLMGNLRMGNAKGLSRNGKPIPGKAESWRVTSPREDWLAPVAAQYGGIVTPWEDGNSAKSNDLFQVQTEASTLEVLMSPTNTFKQANRLFDGTGVQRICDGVDCSYRVESDKKYEGPSMMDAPCICATEAGDDKCDMATIIEVLLPNVALGGQWRLVSKGQNAAEELLASVQMLVSITGGSPQLLPATLTMQQRSWYGGKQQSVVPVLATKNTTEQIMSGDVGEFTSIEPPKLGTQELVPHEAFGELKAAEPEVTDAEVIEEEDDVAPIVDPFEWWAKKPYSEAGASNARLIEHINEFREMRKRDPIDNLHDASKTEQAWLRGQIQAHLDGKKARQQQGETK